MFSGGSAGYWYPVEGEVGTGALWRRGGAQMLCGWRVGMGTLCREEGTGSLSR